MSKRPAFRLMLLGAVAAGLAIAAPPALAFPDAKVDQQIRPNFGGLITPPLKPRHRPDRWKARRHHGGWRGTGVAPTYYDETGDYVRTATVAVVDCSGAVAPATTAAAPSDSYAADSTASTTGADDTGYAPEDEAAGDYGSGGPPAGGEYTSVNDALRDLADNGTLYIRGGVACRETIYIEHPVVIAGEGASVFSGANPQPATIAPPPGAPCVSIAEGVKGVELRDLNLTTQQAGGKSCIAAFDSDLALVRTTVSYWGDASAVYVAGGRLILRDSAIEAKSWDPAVLVEGGTIDLARSKIAAEASGLDLTPGNGESRLDQVGVVARGGETPGDVGILVRGLRSGTGTLTIRNAVVCGWTTGLHLERGAQVDVARSRICDSQRGVISAGTSLSVRESAIGARDVGAYAAGGRASFTRNRFYGGGRAAYAEPGAILELQDNWVYSDGDCWRQRYDRGLYCVSSRNLPGSLRDNSGWSDRRRRGWDADGYDSGFQRDGAPNALPPAQPPAPPKKRGWGRRN
jgi:hypothetical protein